MEGRYTEQGDNWRDGVIVAADQLDAIRLSDPFCESYVHTHAVDQLLENVLADVGANHQGLDAVDRRVIQDVRQRTTTARGSRSGLAGIIDSQSDVGGWPELNVGTAALDTDHDGMPDDWESAHALDPRQPSNNQRLPSSRVTALEVYLAELADKARR